MLCEESVSLLGIRQFYKLVGPDSGSSDAAVNGAQSEPAAAAAQLSVNGLAVNGTSSSAPDGSNAAGEEAAAGRSEAAAEPQLSVAEQQQLLQLKVEVLLQLLSSVSFHQVGVSGGCLLIVCCASSIARWCAHSPLPLECLTPALCCAVLCCPWLCHQAVVFCNRKPSAEWLSRRLTAAGCPAAYLSSDLPQPDVRAGGVLVSTLLQPAPRIRVAAAVTVMAAALPQPPRSLPPPHTHSASLPWRLCVVSRSASSCQLTSWHAALTLTESTSWSTSTCQRTRPRTCTVWGARGGLAAAASLSRC
jgi:hypothetical protein